MIMRERGLHRRFAGARVYDHGWKIYGVRNFSGQAFTASTCRFEHIVATTAAIVERTFDVARSLVKREERMLRKEHRISHAISRKNDKKSACCPELQWRRLIRIETITKKSLAALFYIFHLIKLAPTVIVLLYSESVRRFLFVPSRKLQESRKIFNITLVMLNILLFLCIKLVIHICEKSLLLLSIF